MLFQEALQELLLTRELEPTQADVYGLLSDVYRRLGRQQEAQRALAMMRDLRPRSLIDAAQEAANHLNDDLEEYDQPPP